MTGSRSVRTQLLVRMRPERSVTDGQEVQLVAYGSSECRHGLSLVCVIADQDLEEISSPYILRSNSVAANIYPSVQRVPRES
jgi:hypothetical protein